MIEKNSGKPYMNVIFGNFYSPGYDDPDFVDETMELIKNLGYNSVMFDTKDWEDFRERYKTGERSQKTPPIKEPNKPDDWKSLNTPE